MALKFNCKITKVFTYKGADVDEEPETKVDIVWYDNAYLAINEVKGGKNGMHFTAYTYDTSGKQHLLQIKNYSFTPSVTDGSKNFIAQGYDYLKTLDEFKDAEDC